MSEEQKDRFEFFRRSHFNRESVKKVIGCITQCVVGLFF